MVLKSEESQIILTLQVIRSDPATSIRKAAGIYGVSHVTLSRRVHEKNTVSTR